MEEQNEHEMENYTPFLLEMLAASWAMDYFDTYLKGRKSNCLQITNHWKS